MPEEKAKNTPAQQPKKEREYPMFGTPIFSVPDQIRVQPGRRGGGEFCVAITASVPMANTGLAVDAVIWASKENTSNGPVVTFRASLPRGLKAVAVDAFERKAVQDRFLAHVELGAIRWRGYDAAVEAAYAALTGTKAAEVKTVTPQVERPVLVRKPAAERPAAMPTAPTA